MLIDNKLWNYGLIYMEIDVFKEALAERESSPYSTTRITVVLGEVIQQILLQTHE